MQTLFVLFFSCYSLISAKPFSWSNGNITFEFPGNGQVPKYTFWLHSNESQVYNVFFHQFYEATGEDLKKYGPSNIALPSLAWQWTEPQDDGEGHVVFTIMVNEGVTQFSSFSLVNRIDATNSTARIEEQKPLLKFDLLIDGYTWQSTDPEAKLVLLFDLRATYEGNYKVSNDEIGVEGAYFGINDTALSFDNPDSVTEVHVELLLSHEESTKGIQVVYDHFTGSHFVHDPTIGVYGEGGVNILVIVLPIVGVVVLILIVVGVFYLRRRGYQSV